MRDSCGWDGISGSTKDIKLVWEPLLLLSVISEFKPFFESIVLSPEASAISLKGINALEEESRWAQVWSSELVWLRRV